jgi:predicted transcriptional regulator
MVAGLLDFLHDPTAMARYAELERITQRIAEQMGVTCTEARKILSHFEADTDISGCELH